MNTALLNNHTKFGAEIFKSYRVITFLVLGHFFSRTLYYNQAISVTCFFETQCRHYSLVCIVIRMHGKSCSAVVVWTSFSHVYCMIELSWRFVFHRRV